MTGLNIRLNSMSLEKNDAINYINQDRTPSDLLGVDVEKWTEKLNEVFGKFGVRFELSFSESGEVILTEEGYVEQIADPMMTYNAEVQTFGAIKTTHGLGLLTDEELVEAENYMKSIYPSQTARVMQIVEKPEWFDKFKFLM